MRARQSTSIVLVATATGLCLLATAPFAGCGGGGDVRSSSSSSSGGGMGGGGVGGGAGGGQSKCGDGMVQSPEECDDGNSTLHDGCENDCSFTCTKGTIKGDAACDDADPCNGVETCTDQHTCMSGKPAPDGSACGMGKICKAGVCGDNVCGDGFVSPPEECDDGNTASGDGCENGCTFTCQSADPTACTPPDPCQGKGVCDDATHTCGKGVPLPDGSSCGAAAFCLNGACKAAVCGDGALDPGEQCDDGNTIDGDGCNNKCVFSCVNPASDCAAAPVCQKQSCTAQHVCAAVPDPAQNGSSCGGNMVCQNGACSAPGAVCGNGVKENGEECDFGAGNGPGTGCESTCKFSCTMAPDSCPDANACNGVEACATVTVNGQTGQKCSPGAPLANCAACAGGLCNAGTCKVSQCGDGCVDQATGEQCEPPNTPTCDASCHVVVQAVCGNGVREGSEQCDDSNTTNLDGCDAACKFEQDQRVNYLTMQFTTDAYCPANAMGGAVVGGTAQSQLQTSLDTGIADGSISVLFKMLGLDDLTGTADPMLQVGVMNGTPFMPPPGGMYSGTNDLDWWYTVDPLSIDANRNPTSSLSGSIAAKVLNAGPGAVTLTLLLSGVPASLKLSNTKVNATIGATGAPLMSIGSPPGHVAAEHRDPALVSFTTANQGNANGAAKLCGNVSAASLAMVAIPAALTGGGLLACSQNYTASNTMLDLFVSGCTVLFMQQIKPTQPDQVDPNAPPAGAGGLYKLAANAAKAVSTCRDKNNVVVPLATCLNAAAYSSYFKFTTDRVIIK